MKDLEKRIEDAKTLVEKVMRANEKGERLIFDLRYSEMEVRDAKNGCKKMCDFWDSLYFYDWAKDDYDRILSVYNEKLDKILEVE